MTYKKVISGKFVSRPNRFVAAVDVCGREEIVHVKNTGRCRELLIPGAVVYLAEAKNPKRKTKYDLISVEKPRNGAAPLLVNIDSQIPNAAAEEWLKRGSLFAKDAKIRREVRRGDSRFDFYIEEKDRRSYLEVKGVTLERDGTAMFPDAPTERGVKHINGLISCLEDGFGAYILFVIQMKEIRVFRPNDETHKKFGDALRRAAAAGVTILASDCVVTPDSISIDSPVPVEL